jgi:hypothetical protein
MEPRQFAIVGDLPLTDQIMTPRPTSRNEFLDRMANPTGFLLQSWMVSVAILGVVVVLLIATLTMLG